MLAKYHTIVNSTSTCPDLPCRIPIQADKCQIQRGNLNPVDEQRDFPVTTVDGLGTK